MRLPIRGGRATQRIDDQCARIGSAKKAHTTPPHRLGAIAGIIVRSDENHRRMVAERLQLTLQLETRHASQLDIRQHAGERAAQRISELALLRVEPARVES